MGFGRVSDSGGWMDGPEAPLEAAHMLLAPSEVVLRDLAPSEVVPRDLAPSEVAQRV